MAIHGGETARGKIWAKLRPVAEELFGIDLRALAAFRIGLALLILADLIGRAQDIEAHYTNFGLMPHPAVYLYDGDHFANLSPYMWFDGVVPAGLLMLLAGCFAILLLLGWKTRFSAIVSYILLAGIQSRNPMILTGADLLLRVLAFWAVWLPLGARWSLDGTAAQLRREGRILPVRTLSVATAALLLQIGIMYWFTAIAKDGAEWRKDGTAVYYALSIEQYATPFGEWLRSLGMPLLRLMTFGTILLESVGPTLAFVPWKTARIRCVLVPIFVFFHIVALNLSFDLGPFPFIATLAWLPFLPPAGWDALERLWARMGDNPLQSAALRVRDFFVRWQTQFVDARMASGKRASSLVLGTEAQIAAGFLILYVFVWNMRPLDWATRQNWIPEQLAFVGRMLRLDQGWGMFAPRPLVSDGWFVMPAKLRGDPDYGFDIYTGAHPVDWNKPVHVVSMYPCERWRKYLMNLWVPNNTSQRQYYASWVCRNWNRAHKDLEQLDSFRIIYMEKDTKLNYVAPVIARQPLWEHHCFGVPGQPNGGMPAGSTAPGSPSAPATPGPPQTPAR